MICDYFQLEDLYAAGIGFDLGGAYLLARGLIVAPRMLTLVSGSYYGGNAYLGVSVARDRIDAISGVGALGLGFTLQLVGYLVTLSTTPSQGHGWADALVGLGLAAAALLVALTAGETNKRLRIKPTLVEMAHFDGKGDRQDRPRGDRLYTWGPRGLEIPAHDGEGRASYVKRVFGVDDSVVPKTGGGYEPMTDSEDEA